jgi:hypothetical protein
MSPEGIAALQALMKIIEQLGAWPVASLALFFIISPFLLITVMLYLLFKWVRKIEEFYNSNVVLVKNYESLGKGLTSIAEELRDIVILNTREWSAVGECVRGNQYCPLIRKDRKVEQSIAGE